MATGNMAGGGASGEEERGSEGAPDNVRSSLPCVSLALLSISSSDIASPQIQRKPRSHVPRAARYHPWGFKLPAVLQTAPATKKPTKKANKRTAAKKRASLCAQCGTTKTPMWRTLPTDRQVRLCNACGIRALGAVLPEQVELSPPTKKVSAPPPGPELQLVHRPPPLVAMYMERPAKKRARLCAPCSATETPKWRALPTGRQGMLCNACGIQLMAPAAVLPAKAHLPSPPTVVPEHEQPPPQKIQAASDSESPPDSPCSCSTGRQRQGSSTTTGTDEPVIVIVIDDD